MRCNGYNSQNEEMAQWCSGKYQSADVDSEKLSGWLPILSGGLSDSVYSDRQLRNLSDKARCGLGPKQNNIYQRKRSYQIRLKLESPGSVFRGPQHLQLRGLQSLRGTQTSDGEIFCVRIFTVEICPPRKCRKIFLAEREGARSLNMAWDEFGAHDNLRHHGASIILGLRPGKITQK